MMHPAITTEDWSLMDCQEYIYFVDLEKRLDRGCYGSRGIGTGSTEGQPDGSLQGAGTGSGCSPQVGK
jgi:hypothetical protein